ncbi:MAG TPA: hypothetical protein VJW51_12200 [Candidatus Acidoferrales bacterium]|nr:hypothetical protein [Candidatus Acidoferrales bacterium]
MRNRRPFSSIVSLSLSAGFLATTLIPLLSCNQGSAARRSFSFTTIDFPGTNETLLFKINSSGVIVGAYFDGPNVEHGFLLQAGSFGTFDVPNGVGATQPEGINDSSEVTGTYYDATTGLEPGFLRQPDGSVVDIVPPDSGGYTEANGINNSGTIAGRDLGTVFQGFLFSNGSYTYFDVPGATNTSLFGINNLGDIVGDYIDAGGVQHGFVMSNGSVTTIDPPGSTNTNCQGINDSGEIVGSFVLGGVRHGYRFSNGNFTQIDFPGASPAGAGAPLSGTDVHGINTSGEIVGTHMDSAGVIHGFLAQ